MADAKESSGATTGDAMKVLIEMLMKDEAFKRSLGENTSLLILITLGVATAELTIGLPVITLASTPFVGVLITFLIASVKTFLRSGKPSVIFYLCPNSSCTGQRVFPIAWTSLPKYRKWKACAACGASLVKKCPKGDHYIVSPDPSKPESPPPLTAFCQFCAAEGPDDKRKFLPAPSAASAGSVPGPLP